MRNSLAVLFCLLVLLGPAAAEDEKKDEPQKPAMDMTEAEREAALNKADALEPRIRAELRGGNNSGAIALARQALDIRERILGPTHQRVASSLNNLADLLLLQGAYKECRALVDRALKIQEATLGREHRDVAHTLVILGVLLRDQANYERARPHLERALKISEAAYGPEHTKVAYALKALASLHAAQGARKRARPLYERALEIYETVNGPEHPTVGKCLNDLANLLRELGEFEQAVPLLERALKLQEKALGPDHRDVAMSLNTLAGVRHALGDFEKAEPLLERALKINEKVFGPEHPKVGTSTQNLAWVLRARGALERARPLFERALKIAEKAHGPHHISVAHTLSNLAQVLHGQGAPERARPLLERALRIYEKILGAKHSYVAQGLNNLASMFMDQGALDQARPLMERALKIFEKALGPEHAHVAVSRNNLGLLLTIQGEYERARPHIERALKTRQSIFGQEHPALADSLTSLAHLLRARGADDEARSYYERALSIREKAFGPEHPRVAASLNNLALLLRDQGALVQARPLLERALVISGMMFGPEHPRVALSLYNLSSVLRGQGEHDEAAQLMARCLSVTEGHVRQGLSGLQRSARAELLGDLRKRLGTWLQIAPRIAGSGYAETLRIKGILAREAAAERRLVGGASAKELGRIDALRAAERRLARIANAPPPFRSKAKKAQWREAYAKAAAEREQLALALARDFAPLRAGLDRLGMGLRDIQAALTENDVLVDYVKSGDRYIAWVVTHEGEVKRVDLVKAEGIEAATAMFTEQAADPDEAAWRKSARALRDSIFKPLEQHLPKGTTTIHICPDAALAAVPFGALPAVDGRPLLGEKYTLSTVSMAQDLVPWNDEPKPGKGALLLGGVDYGKASTPEKSGQPRALVDRAPRGGKYLYLAGTKAEVTAIKPGLGKGTTTVLGPDATEAVVRTASKGKRVIHLATHGFVRSNLMRGLIRRRDDKQWLGAAMERQLAAGHDPMSLSGLAMAGANTRKGGGDDDGILTALEASHLDLDGVELVVLSACQTALGTAESGEGVIGLVRGFQMAGAKQVIGSLWKVDDDATKALMVKMYELWAPKDGKKRIAAAVALKKAQAYVRSQEKWKHPYYWAAWVTWGVGD